MLVARLAGLGRLRGCGRARALVGLSDGRARTVAESVLRVRWLDAGLPAPAPHLQVAEEDLVLALPAERFGVVLGLVGTAAQVADWTVLPLTAGRVLGSDAGLLEAHLRREYLRHLLRRAG
jgi:hypothetical protein